MNIMNYINSFIKKIKGLQNVSHRNIFIIGNGEDRSLQLPSGFSQYINSKNLKQEYFEIQKYIHLFYKYRNKISNKLSYIINKCNYLGKKTNISLTRFDLDWIQQWNNNPYIKGDIDTNKLADDFINIKFYFKNYFSFLSENFDYNISKITLKTNNTKLKNYINKLNKEIISINTMGNNALKDFNKVILNINNNKINFWTLLIIFQGIQSNNNRHTLLKEFRSFSSYIQSVNKYKNYSKFHKMIDYIINYLDSTKITITNEINIINNIKSYCSKNNIFIDISRLKIYLYNISTIQDSIDLESSGANWSDVENIIKYFLISLSNINNSHSLNYYFKGTNGFDENYFNSYMFINEYFNSLNNLRYDYKKYINNKNINKDDKAYQESTNLYNFIINKNNFNNENMYVHNILLPKINFTNLLNDGPLILLIQFIFGKQLFSQELDINPYNDFSLFSLKFLSKQLSQFENQFRSYLQSLIPNKSTKRNHYINDSYKLLNNIANKIYKNNLSESNKFEVLDFNYTPLNYNIRTKEHIHGSLKNKNIIIGIGDIEIDNLIDKIDKEINHTNILIINYEYNHNNQKIHNLKKYKNKQIKYKNYYNNILKFTKTYRILEMKNKNYESSFNDDSFKNIDNIIFFGHSLGVNDYPYFDALFDRMNIYNSTTKLIFCYSKFYKGDNEEYRKNSQIKNIIRLLRHYGQTISNKNHGQNLISKMLMENRIQFLSVTNCINEVKPLKLYKPHY